MSPYPFRPAVSMLSRVLLCAALLFFTPPATGVRAAVLWVDGAPKTVPLSLYLDFLPDEAGELDIGDAASPARAEGYKPLVRGIPRQYSGPLWLRLSLAGTSSAGDASLVLDLGREAPGTTRLFSLPPAPASAPAPVAGGLPGHGAELWESFDASGHALFSLPAPNLAQATLYLRLEGPPGLWFSPTLRAETAGKPAPLPVDLALQALLAAALLMSLLRAVGERAQWRLWAALLTVAALVQALFPSGAAAPAGGPVSPQLLAALLSPGFMLMLLPHVGRQLLQSPRRAAGADFWLRLLPVPGAALALAPLVPGFAWISRYLCLWPALLLPLFLVALTCLTRRLPGSLAFFAACLAPLLGVVSSLLELVNAAPPLLGASGPVWGMAFGCLALALAPAASAAGEEEARATDADGEADGRGPEEAPVTVFQLGEPAKPILDFTPPRDAALREAAALNPASDGVMRPLDELSPRRREETPGAERPVPGKPAGPSKPGEPAKQGKPAEAGPAQEEQSPPQPAAKTWTLPPLATQSGPMSFPGLTPAKKAEPAASIAPMPSMPSIAEPAASMPSIAEDLPPAGEMRLFDLFRLLKETHAAVEDEAEQKGLGLSWHVSPHIARYYEGEDELLGEALTLLLRGAVRSTARGAVELSVRGLPGNEDPGHLVFALGIRGGDAAVRPWDLTAVGRIWALAERCGGFFSLDHTQAIDMSVVFSMRFLVPDAEDAPAARAVTDALEPLPDLFAAGMPAAPQIPAPSGPDGARPLTAAAPPLSLEDSAARSAPGIAETWPQQEPWQAARVILADMTPRGRRQRAQDLDGLPYALLEADSAAAALALYARSPSGVALFDADMPETDIRAAITDLRRLEEARSWPRAGILALCSHDLQARRLRDAGCDAALIKPVSREQLQASVLALTPHVEVPETVEAPVFAAPETLEKNLHATLTPPAGPPAPPEKGQLAEAELVAMGLDRSCLPAEAERQPERQAEPQGQVQHAEERKARPPASGETQDLPAPVRELPLLDLIITDIDPEHPDPPAQPVQAAHADQGDRQAPAPVAPAPAAVNARRRVTPRPDRAAQPVQSAQEKRPEASRLVVRVKSSVQRTAEQADTAKATAASAPAEQTAPQAAAAASEATSHTGTPKSPPVIRVTSRDPRPGKLPLPDLNDAVYADMLPFVPGLIYTLGDMLKDARRGREQHSCLLVQDAAERLSGKAAAFGLENLERMARCVERAAAADDTEAVGELLGELITLTERYQEALRACHRDAQ